MLAAFAFRLYAADTTWVDKDRANPHAIGLIVVDAIRAGRFADLPLFSDPASIGLPNPPLISYALALVALFDRSLGGATVIGLMLNSVGVAITYRVARRLFNWEAAVIAATLMAASNWGVYLARGAWHPAHLEIGAVLCVWQLADGLHDRRPRSLVRGFVAAALTAGAYVAAFSVVVQAVLATIAAGAPLRELRKAWLAGLGICLAGSLLYVLALSVGGQLDELMANRYLPPVAPFTPEELAARDVTDFTRQALPHFFRLASNAEYAVTWTHPAVDLHSVRVPLAQIQAALVSLSVLLGALVLARRWRMPAHRFLLAWAFVPIAVLMNNAANNLNFRIPPYYLLVTSPVMYLCGGLGAELLLRRLRASATLTVALCGGLMILPAWNFHAAAQTVYAQSYVGVPTFMPLRWAQRLGTTLRDECRTLAGPGNAYEWWAISLAERPDIRREEGARFNEVSSAWSIPPGGGACALKQAGPPMPNAEFLWVPLDDGTRLRVDRALPYAGGDVAPTTVNLGWTLLDYGAPRRISAGETLTVRHAWRVDRLPAEPHGEWYFTPFIKLYAPGRRQVADVSGAVSILGWGWFVGEVILSDAQVRLPADLSPGEYTIESSLFDPNQKKNAVYFEAGAPGVPILSLTRTVVVVAP